MVGTINKFIEYFDDSSIEEIYYNGKFGLGILKSGELKYVPEFSVDNEKFIFELQEYVLSKGLRIDRFFPSAGGMIEDVGIRWHFIIPPAAPMGPIVSMRKHQFDKLSIDDFSLTKEEKELLRSLFINESHILICGETGSGKTSLLSTCLRHWSKNHRVLILEDLDEITAYGRFWTKLLTCAPDVRGMGRISYSTLLKDCFRIRPDRIVFGELKDIDGFRVFDQALASGHKGIIATMHASSVLEIKNRFESDPALLSNLLSSHLYCIFMNRRSRNKKIKIEKFL